MGGNRTPVFEDLEQILSNKTLDDVILTGTVTLPSSASTFLEFVKAHTDSAQENLVSFRLDEATTSSLSIRNGSTGNAAFLPALWFTQMANTGTGGYIIGQIHGSFDSGSNPVIRLDGRAHYSALSVRPIVSISNQNTDEYVFEKDEADFKNNALINVSLDGDDGVTFANIPDDALSTNVPLLDTANTFTAVQTIDAGTGYAMLIKRDTFQAGLDVGIAFNELNNASETIRYAAFLGGISDNTDGSEDGTIKFQTAKDGILGTVLYTDSAGLLKIGRNQRLLLSEAGQTTAHTFVFQDIAGHVATEENANIFTDLQRIELDAEAQLELFRPNSIAGDRIGMEFKGINAASEEIEYGKFYFSVGDDTDGSEDSSFGVLVMSGGTQKIGLYLSNSGLLSIGVNNKISLSVSGQTANHIFTFPNQSGQLALEGALGSIDDLTDVDTSTSAPANNDVLTWNSTSGEWVPAAPPGASGGEANTLTNVGSEIELVKTKVGVNYDIRTLEAGTNVTITQNTDTVTIDATDTVTDALTDLTTDVSISSPSNNQVLAYNSTSSKWENNSFNAEKTGTATGDGNGSSVEFTVNHGLGSVPSSHFIQCYSHSIPFTWDIDSSDFTITFDFSSGVRNG